METTGHNVNTDSSEIRQLFALHMLVGILKFPRLRMYWTDATRIPIIADTMSVNRFMKLRSNLHVVVEKPQNDDRLWKVRPVIETVLSRCHELSVEENVCIDEKIVPFKGQLDIKQYMQNKPYKWGIKVFLLCGSSGIVYDGLVSVIY
jgi:Transposase IS4